MVNLSSEDSGEILGKYVEADPNEGESEEESEEIFVDPENILAQIKAEIKARAESVMNFICI